MDDSPQVAENSVRIRRPSLKKRLADESDEDDGPRRPSNAARKAKSRKRARTDSTEATPTPQELEVDIDGDIDMDAPVDIEGDANSARGFPYEPAAASQRNAVRSAPSKRAKPKTESKAGSSSKRVGKKRQVVWSDEEDEEDATPAMDASARVQSFSEQDDDDFELPTRGVLPKGKGSSTAAKNGKGLVSTKAGKRKSTNDDSKPIMMKDESKPKLSEFSIPSEDRSTPDAIGPSARGAGPSVKSESDIANDLPLHSLEDTKQVAALPAKRKFPTIKKNKPSASGPSTAVSAPIVSKSSNPATLPKPPAPPGVVGQVSAAQRKPALTAGNKDLDLFNSNIYAELFNKGGSSTPRSGVNRREKDDRRKELDRMREEARTAREADAKNCFDLQAQSDKVARFEDRLRTGRTRAYLPNFIAGALQDRYDREQRALTNH